LNSFAEEWRQLHALLESRTHDADNYATLWDALAAQAISPSLLHHDWDTRGHVRPRMGISGRPIG
jgi:hypothetical protein